MFPRAKLQRFNEVTSCAPPPGAYDPKFEEKVKGLVIEKTERFVDPKPTTTTPGNLGDLSRSSSLQTLPTFRTPQLPRRIVRKVSSASKFKPESAGTARKRIENDFETKSEGGSTPDITTLGARKLEISSLNDLYQKAKGELQKSTERCNNLEKDIKSDKEMIARLEQEKVELKAELDNIIEELAKRSDDYKSAIEQCNLLDAKLAERKAAVEELEQAKLELQFDIEDLKKRAEQNASEIEEVSHRCLELESELADSVALNSRLENDRAERMEEVAALTEQIKSLSAEVSAKTEQCAALESGELNLVLEVERKVMALDEMNKEMKLRDECIYELENNVASCRSDILARVAENEELRARQGKMEGDISELTSQLTDCQKNCALLEQEKALLIEDMVALESVRDSLEECGENLMRELEEMHSAVLENNSVLEEAHTRIATLQLEKEKLCGDIGMQSGKIARLEQDASEKQLVIVHLESDLSACHTDVLRCKCEADRQLSVFSKEIENIKNAHDIKMAEVQKELEKNVAACEARVLQAQAEHECELAKLRNLAYKLEQKVLEEREGHQRVQRELDEERHAAEVHADEKEKEIISCRYDLVETRNNLVNVENTLKEKDKQHVDAVMRHKEELDEVYCKVAALEQALWEERKRAEAKIEFHIRESEAAMLQIRKASEEAAREAEERLRLVEEKHGEKLHQIDIATEELLRKTREEAFVQLEQLKAESETKVREAEAEVSSILMKLSEAEEQLRILSSERDTLRTADLDRQIQMVELQDRVHVMETELVESRRRHTIAIERLKRNLELIGNETLATVNAMGQRLWDREVEVDRLTRLNRALEEHNNEQKENISVVESECLRQVEDIRISLLAKLEEFRQKGVDEINRLQDRVSEMVQLVDYYKEELLAANARLETRDAEVEEQSAQINSMQESMNVLNDNLDRLAEKLSELDTLKQAHNALQTLLKDLNVELQQARQDAADAETEIEAREKQIDDLTSQLEDVNDQLRKVEENYADEMDVARKDIEDLTAAKAELRSQLEALNTLSECHRMNFVQATQRIETLQSLVRKKDAQLSEYSKNMDEVAEELAMSQAAVEELKEEVELKKDALSSLNIRLSDMQNSLEETEKKAADLMAERDFEKTIRQDSEQQIADMYEELAERDRKIQDGKETVCILESEISDRKVTISSLENQLRDTKERISILKDEAEDSLKQIADAEQTIVKLQAVKSELESKIGASQEEKQDLSDVIDNQREELKAVKSQLESEKDAVKYLKSCIEVNHKALQAAECSKLTLEGEIGSLRMRLEMIQMDMDESVRQKDAALKKSEEKIEHLEEELSSLRLEADSSKAAFEEMEKEFRDEISELKEVLERKEIESTENAENLKKRVKDVETELKDVTKRKETYKGAVVELQQLVKQNKGHIVSLESDLAATRTDRDEAVRKLSEMEGRIAAAADWEQRCIELENLIGPFREELEAFEAEKKALEVRKEAAEGEAKELADKYAKIVGHQNPKQRIHHVVYLKETIQNLRKEKALLETKLRTQKRTIERLKDELSASNGGRFNHSSVFQGREDSIQGRLSSVISKPNIEHGNQSSRNRLTMSVKSKGKENLTEISTPAPARPLKVKEELSSPAHQSPVRSSPVGSPITPLKERQNNLN